MQYAEDGMPHYGHGDGAASGMYDPHRQSMMNHHVVYNSNHVPIANHVMGSGHDQMCSKRDKDAIFGNNLEMSECMKINCIDCDKTFAHSCE
ncbi:hypothetical protein AVEN_257752-1 [Araneus ventricosus]|uniref:Uncharacterized protein n=1 Tax=Araneus ventricosus TaxID=182803 RepID=A0A4Y2TXT7_ARAVE|nr:hypothetical protein AVEN_257752-1 [Araneus ventricosus]